MKQFFSKGRGWPFRKSLPHTYETANQSDDYWNLFESLRRTPTNQPDAISTFHAIDIALRTGGCITDIPEIFTFAILHMRLCMKKCPLVIMDIDRNATLSAIWSNASGSLRRESVPGVSLIAPQAGSSAVSRPLSLALSVGKVEHADSLLLKFWKQIEIHTIRPGNITLILSRDTRSVPRSLCQRLPLLSFPA